MIERERNRFLTELEYSNLMEDMSEMAGNCGIVTVQRASVFLVYLFVWFVWTGGAAWTEGCR